MAGEVRTTRDDDNSRSLREPLDCGTALERNDVRGRRHDLRRRNRGEELRLHARRNFNDRKVSEHRPRFAERSPLRIAERAELDVPVRALPCRRIERLGQQQRPVLLQDITFVDHWDPPRPSPVSAFFRVSIARKTRVFTAPSEQPAICAISAYDNPWYRDSRIASRCSGVRVASAFRTSASF